MAEHRIIGRSPTIRPTKDCGCLPFEPTSLDLTCPVSLGDIHPTTQAGAPGNEGGYPFLPSVTLAPETGPVVLFGALGKLYGSNHPTAGSGFSEDHIWTAGGARDMLLEYKAVATVSGSYVVDADSDGLWEFIAFGLRTGATTPVNVASASADWISQLLITIPTPTPGNILIAYHLYGTNNTLPNPGPTTDWQTITTMRWLDDGSWMRATLYAACARAGMATTLNFPGGSGGLGAGVIIEEWEISGTTLDPDAQPEPGQSVFDETITPATDGLAALFSTTYPYRARSLRVYCDGINVTNDLNENAPDSGTFSLAWAPAEDDVLLAEYEGY